MMIDEIKEALNKGERLITDLLYSRRKKDRPCFECIKRGGVCNPQCEKRTRRWV